MFCLQKGSVVGDGPCVSLTTMCHSLKYIRLDSIVVIPGMQTTFLLLLRLRGVVFVFLLPYSYSVMINILTEEDWYKCCYYTTFFFFFSPVLLINLLVFDGSLTRHVSGRSVLTGKNKSLKEEKARLLICQSE